MLFHDRDLLTDCLTWRRIEQVIAPLLIIRRVANKSALTRDTVVSGRTSSLKFWTQGKSTGGSSSLSDGPTIAADEYGMNSGESKIEVESAIDFHQGKV